MPGRCAAPPAPAMMAWSPRATAPSAYANMSSGMRCAETTRASKGMPNSARMWEAAFIVSQSLADPMTTPTTGEALFKITPGKSMILAGGTNELRMIDITLQNFETDLLHDSMKQPILLDIWAPWCGPCRSLGPMLEKLEVAYEGRFKLA